MADKATSTPKATTPKAKLAPVSESGEPDVHRLVALRQSAVQGEDKDEVKRIDAALAALGYTV